MGTSSYSTSTSQLRGKRVLNFEEFHP